MQLAWSLSLAAAARGASTSTAEQTDRRTGASLEVCDRQRRSIVVDEPTI